MSADVIWMWMLGLTILLAVTEFDPSESSVVTLTQREVKRWRCFGAESQRKDIDCRIISDATPAPGCYSDQTDRFKSCKPICNNRRPEESIECANKCPGYYSRFCELKSDTTIPTTVCTSSTVSTQASTTTASTRENNTSPHLKYLGFLTLLLPVLILIIYCIKKRSKTENDAHGNRNNPDPVANGSEPAPNGVELTESDRRTPIPEPHCEPDPSNPDEESRSLLEATTSDGPIPNEPINDPSSVKELVRKEYLQNRQDDRNTRDASELHMCGPVHVHSSTPFAQ